MMELYSPDKWTETSEKLLATVADDSDLYLQKVMEIVIIYKMLIIGCRCRVTAETYLTRCSTEYMWEISE